MLATTGREIDMFGWSDAIEGRPRHDVAGSRRIILQRGIEIRSIGAGKKGVWSGRNNYGSGEFGKTHGRVKRSSHGRRSD